MASPFDRDAIPSVSIGNVTPGVTVGDGETYSNPIAPPGSEIPGQLVALATPELVSPPDGYIMPWTEERVTLRWLLSRGASGNALQVSTSSEFEASRTTEIHIPAAFFFSGILPFGEYYWRVKAYDLTYGRYSRWSAPWRFTRSDERTEEPEEPGPDSDDESPGASTPGPDDEAGTEGGTADNAGVLRIIRIDTSPNPVGFGGSVSLTSQLENVHPIASYQWDINGDGTLTVADQETGSFTAPNLVTETIVGLIVTDSEGNTATLVDSISTRNVESDSPAGDVGTGCTEKVGEIKRIDLSALGWGADTTSTDPSNPAFPDGGEKFSNQARDGDELGATAWSADAGAWFRYYVLGHQVIIHWPATARSGLLKLTITRLDPFVDSAVQITTLNIDQSSDVSQDAAGDDCWLIRSTVLDFGTLTGDPYWGGEWKYNEATQEWRRYVYRLDFEWGGVGAVTSDEYGDWYAALQHVEWHREDVTQIIVDSDADWNLGTLYGSTVSGGKLNGQIAAGTTFTSDSRRQKYYVTGWSFTWSVLTAESLSGWIAANWAGGDANFWGLIWSVAFIGGLGYRIVAINNAGQVRVKRSELIAGTTATLRLRWYETDFLTRNQIEYAPESLMLDLRRGTPSGSTLSPGTLIGSRSYWGKTADGANYYYVEYEIDADTILAYPDDGGGYTTFYAHVRSWLTNNPFPASNPGDGYWQSVRTSELTLSVQGSPQWYQSKVYDLGRVFDFSESYPQDQLRLIVDKLSIESESIKWRAAETVEGLAARSWVNSPDGAFIYQRVRYVQFKVEFLLATPGWVDSIQLVVREGHQPTNEQ